MWISRFLFTVVAHFFSTIWLGQSNSAVKCIAHVWTSRMSGTFEVCVVKFVQGQLSHLIQILIVFCKTVRCNKSQFTKVLLVFSHDIDNQSTISLTMYMRAMRAAIILSIHPPVTSFTYTRSLLLSYKNFDLVLGMPLLPFPWRSREREEERQWNEVAKIRGGARVELLNNVF